MGSTFSLFLIPAPDGAKCQRDALKAHYKSRGFARARSREEGDYTARLYAEKSGRWLALAGDAPGCGGSHEQGVKEAGRLALALKTPVIFASNHDSDALLLTLCDGERAETLQYDLENEDAPPAPAETPLWDGLLGERAADLKALFGKEHVFSEDILGEAAPLTGWMENAAVLPFADQIGAPKPLATLSLSDKASGFSFLMDRDAPPALCCRSSGEANPIVCAVEPAGGEGRGVVVEVRAFNYDPEDYTIPDSVLRCRSVETAGLAAGEHPQTVWKRSRLHAVPERHVFPDGRKGWIARFPEVEIARGPNWKHPELMPRRADIYASDHEFVFYATILGPVYYPNYQNMPQKDLIELTEPSLAFLQRYRACSERGEIVPDVRYTEVSVVPVENPAGASRNYATRLIEPWRDSWRFYAE